MTYLRKKIYEVDPLTCPKCSGEMKVISVIEDEEVIKKILKHLGLWDSKARPPPKAVLPENTFKYNIDYSSSQLLPDSDNLSRASRSNEWLYVDPEPDYF
jgi:hypothetical protein